MIPDDTAPLAHHPHNLLITGGAGFIGTNYVYHRLAANPENRLVVLDALNYAGRRANLATAEQSPGLRFVQGSITDQPLLEKLLREEEIDTIVHFAAESHVDRSISGPDPFIETNVVGTHILLKAARKAWLSGSGRPHRFHHISTDEVYGSLGPDDPPFRETTPYAPNSPYAASKAASDHLVRSYHHTYGLQTTISNCSNNYGPYQFPEKLIPLVTLNILHGRPLPVYGDGGNIRDWLHVDDHCRGIDLILDRGRIGEVYNLGGDNEWNNLDLVRQLCRLLDEKFAANPRLVALFPAAPASRGGKAADLLTFVDDRPGHDHRYAIDFNKSRQELGYRPRQDFIEGLNKTVQWYIDAVINRSFITESQAA